MATLNCLLEEADLAKLTNDQREFLVQRIDHIFQHNPEILKIVGHELQHSVNLVAPAQKLKIAAQPKC